MGSKPSSSAVAAARIVASKENAKLQQLRNAIQASSKQGKGVVPVDPNPQSISATQLGQEVTGTQPFSPDGEEHY
jgi:hypothetical protein